MVAGDLTVGLTLRALQQDLVKANFGEEACHLLNLSSLSEILCQLRSDFILQCRDQVRLIQRANKNIKKVKRSNVTEQ